jgi:hypothetical protein
MSLTPDTIAEGRFHYLEMIQAVIDRAANNSATLKNLCVTVVTAVCGVTISTEGNPELAVIALLPILASALLDLQYLRVEKAYRLLYDGVRNEDWSLPPSFNLKTEFEQQVPFLEAVESWSFWLFYVPLTIGVLLVIAWGLS